MGLLALSLPAWAGNDQQRVEKLRPVLVVLQRLQVSVYRDQDWCRCFRYPRGAFILSSHESTCGLFQEKGRPFDRQASLDFQEMAMTRKKCGVDFDWVTARYAKNKLVSAEFALSGWSRDTYCYEPGYQLPKDEGRRLRYRKINSDFYLREED